MISMINRDITMPQANDLSLIIKTVEGITKYGWDKVDWAIKTGFRERQYGYYANAAAWLGLIEVSMNGKSKNYIANSNSNSFLNMPDKYDFLSTLLRSDPLFAHIISFSEGERMQQGVLYLDSNQKIYGTYPSLAVRRRRVQCFCSWASQLNL